MTRGFQKFIPLLATALVTLPLAAGSALAETPAREPRHPNDVFVVVYNGSGLELAGGVQGNELRGLGYGTRVVTEPIASQDGTTISCRVGFRAEAKELAKIVNSAEIVDQSTPPTSEGVDADCIVIVGVSHPLPPFLVSVALFNAAGLSGAASTQADKLQVRGYVIATVDNAPMLQVGTTIACRDGYEQERKRLAKRIKGATAVPFPTGDYLSVEAFPAVAYAHCVVIVGSEQR